MAGSTSNIRAGGAAIELSLQDKFTKALDAAAKKLKDFGKAITTIGKDMAKLGLAIVTPLLGAAQQFASMSKEMLRAAKVAGTTVETMSALRYAADQTAVSYDELEVGLRQMQKHLLEAGAGSKEAIVGFASLGLSFAMLKDLSPEDQFALIGDKLADVTDPAARAAIAIEIFGRSGAKLLPLLLQGSKGIKDMRQHAEDLGIVMSTKDAEAGNRFAQVLMDLWKQVRYVTYYVGAAIAQALQPFGLAANRALKATIDWTKTHKPAVIGILSLGLAITAAGGAIIGLGIAFTTLGAILSGITTVFGAIGGVIAFLVSPVGLVIAALAALATYFIFASDTGQAVIDYLKSKFGELSDTAKTTFGGIADALKAGDIQLAGQILWTGLQLAWVQGTQGLQNTWARFKAGFVKLAADAFFGVREIWADVSAGLRTAFTNVTSFFSDLWSSMTGMFADLWDSTLNKVVHGINYVHGLFDDDFDADAANNADDDRLAGDKGRRAQDEINAAAANEAARAKAVADIQAEHDALIAELAKRNADIDAGADANAKQDVADLEKRKADLEKKLAEMRKTAGGEAKKADDLKKPTLGDPSKQMDLDDVLANRKNIDLKSAGTFNAFAIQSLQGGGSVHERVAKFTERTAKATEAMAKKKGGTFS